jgi:hypothetical protein
MSLHAHPFFLQFECPQNRKNFDTDGVFEVEKSIFVRQRIAKKALLAWGLRFSGVPVSVLMN